MPVRRSALAVATAAIAGIYAVPLVTGHVATRPTGQTSASVRAIGPAAPVAVVHHAAGGAAGAAADAVATGSVRPR